MKKWIVIVLLLAIGCAKAPEINESKSVAAYSLENIQYFEKGVISSDTERDTSTASYLSEILKNLKEPSFTLGGEHEVLRLLIISGVYNPLIIRIEHADSLTSVTFKVAGDRAGRERTSLSHLTLHYESSSERMDSLYALVTNSINSFHFQNVLDEPSEDVVADGTLFLLERSTGGTHKVVVVTGLGLMGKPKFEESAQFYAIVSDIIKFVPDQLWPDIDNAKTVKDLVFPVLRR